MPALNLATLPLDVLEPIVSQLDQRDVKKVSLTCSALRSVALPRIFSTFLAKLASSPRGVFSLECNRLLRARPTSMFPADVGEGQAAERDPPVGSYVRVLSVRLYSARR